MELPNGAYQALEDIVGPEYITQEPAIRDTYNQVWGNKLVYDNKFSVRPAAVLLPENTEEIQAVAKVCNRYKIPYKAFSSGFEIVATVDSEKAIILDLRRMNRILEIDVKNMHAVVEPYVSVYRLQMETAKYGVHIGCISAGPSGGVIASACCHFGSGFSDVSTGGLGRGVLGTEWVLPTGEVLRLGTSETGSGWFSADGPGISLRGVLRGHSGANGGHGVITKASVKLYPWYGPPEWEHVGGPPGVKYLEKILDGYKTYVLTFPSKDIALDAIAEIGKAEITYAVVTMVGGAMMGEGNDEFFEKVRKMTPEEGEVLGRSVQATIGANSIREMEYREKCLLKIGERLGGVLVPQLNEPSLLSVLFSSQVWSFHTVAEVLRSTGDFFISPTIESSKDVIKNAVGTGTDMVGSYMKRGVLVDTGDVPVFVPPYENYTVGCHVEHIYMYDPYDDYSVTETRKLVDETLDPKGRCGRFGMPLLGGGLQIEPVSHVHQKWGRYYDNYNVWLRKIKKALDPNNVCDSSAYIPPDYPHIQEEKEG